MTKGLTDERILETTEQFFRTGISSFRVIGLSKQGAERYSSVIEGVTSHCVEVEGPSILNDIYKAIPLYSVEVSLSGGSNA